MSPEQIQGHAVDGRSDLYSLGVTLYHLIAGRPPFDDTEALALAVKHLHETPEPIDRARGKDDIPAWLVAVVSRLLRKAPQERFASAADVLAVVEQQQRLASGADDTPTGSAATDTTQVEMGGSGSGSGETVMLPGEFVGGSPTAMLGTATVQLQRVTEASQAATRRRKLRAIAYAIVAVGCLLAGIGMSRRTAQKRLPNNSIRRVLHRKRRLRTSIYVPWTWRTRRDGRPFLTTTGKKIPTMCGRRRFNWQGFWFRNAGAMKRSA